MLTHAERGRLGGLSSAKKQIRKNNIQDYNLNPKICNNCGTNLDYDQRKYKFCSRSCAITVNNNKRITLTCCENCKTLSKNIYCSSKCKEEKRFILGELKTPSAIRRHLIRTVKYECQICKIYDWQNNKITLQVDHMDGNYLNNLPENLRLLCPNCHSQTDTFGIKNLGKGRHKRRERYAQGKSN